MNQTIIDASIVAEINREHELAQKAVEHGLRVGELLLQVKESLPNGEFSNWLAQNVNMSDRQAKKYQNRLNHRLNSCNQRADVAKSPRVKAATTANTQS